jgi:hypothetical protein
MEPIIKFSAAPANFNVFTLVSNKVISAMLEVMPLPILGRPSILIDPSTCTIAAGEAMPNPVLPEKTVVLANSDAVPTVNVELVDVVPILTLPANTAASLNNEVPSTVSKEVGAVVPIPNLPVDVKRRSEVPVEEAISKRLTVLVPCTVSVATGLVVPIPILLSPVILIASV